MAHPYQWALAFLGSGFGGSYANRRRLRGVVSLSHAIASMEAPFWRTRREARISPRPQPLDPPDLPVVSVAYPARLGTNSWGEIDASLGHHHRHIGRLRVNELRITATSAGCDCQSRWHRGERYLHRRRGRNRYWLPMGSGTLTYQGQQYPFRVNGLSVVDVGVTRVTGSGSVHNLRNVADFSGNYVSIAAGVTVAGGGSVGSLRNQNGVVIDGVTTTQGVRLTLAPGGVSITLSGQPSWKIPPLQGIPG